MKTVDYWIEEFPFEFSKLREFIEAIQKDAFIAGQIAGVDKAQKVMEKVLDEKLFIPREGEDDHLEAQYEERSDLNYGE